MVRVILNICRMIFGLKHDLINNRFKCVQHFIIISCGEIFIYIHTVFSCKLFTFNCRIGCIDIAIRSIITPSGAVAENCNTITVKEFSPKLILNITCLCRIENAESFSTAENSVTVRQSVHKKFFAIVSFYFLRSKSCCEGCHKSDRIAEAVFAG